MGKKYEMADGAVETYSRRMVDVQLPTGPWCDLFLAISADARHQFLPSTRRLYLSFAVISASSSTSSSSLSSSQSKVIE